ncbi:hypothetical protein PAXRUDRAFT_151346, partial [Paxillus rubicundulus Ve08.2h10]
HSTQYPILSHMTHDYHSIQGSSTPSERSFSQGGLTVTLLCNSLHPDTAQPLQLLKNSYSSGDLTAAAEALQWEAKSWTANVD